jgi:hypothetical protein
LADSFDGAVLQPCGLESAMATTVSRADPQMKVVLEELQSLGGKPIESLSAEDARALANAADAVVVSVEYRKAPEYKFPAAHEDAYAAYRWALTHAVASD